MFERFAGESRRAVVRAQDVARRLGAERIEPEHLLLALAGHSDPAARAIAEAGLDADAIEQAIELELVASLEAVGVPASVVESTPALARSDSPRFSIAAKQALERAMRATVARGRRRLGSEHLLLGLLHPSVVGVRRILARLDVEPSRLQALVEVEIAAGR